MTFEYDESQNVLKFDEPRAARLLRSILIARKFNEGFDSKLLFNEVLNDLIRTLPALAVDQPPIRWPNGEPPGYPDLFLEAVAKGIASEHKDGRRNWLGMSQEDQVKFVEQIVLFPNSISGSDIQKVIGLVNVRLSTE